MTIRGTWRANSSDSANSVHTAPTAGVNHWPYAVQFGAPTLLGGENRLACVHLFSDQTAISRPLRSWFQRGLAGEGAGYRDQD